MTLRHHPSGTTGPVMAWTGMAAAEPRRRVGSPVVHPGWWGEDPAADHERRARYVGRTPHRGFSARRCAPFPTSGEAITVAEPCPGSAARDRGGGGMKITVQVVLHADEDTQTVVREVFTLTREALAPDIVGLQLQEAKGLLAAAISN